MTHRPPIGLSVAIIVVTCEIMHNIAYHGWSVWWYFGRTTFIFIQNSGGRFQVEFIWFFLVASYKYLQYILDPKKKKLEIAKYPISSKKLTAKLITRGGLTFRKLHYSDVQKEQTITKIFSRGLWYKIYYKHLKFSYFQITSIQSKIWRLPLTGIGQIL